MSEPPAAAVLAELVRADERVATAESLTGGLLAATLTDIPGASAAYTGGLVSYDWDVKARVLGVDRALLESGGAVQAEVALQMADGARRVCGADWGVATTGVAGPEPSDGQPVGTVYVAITSADVRWVECLAMSGDRASIRAQTVAVCLDQLNAHLRARAETG